MFSHIKSKHTVHQARVASIYAKLWLERLFKFTLAVLRQLAASFVAVP